MNRPLFILASSSPRRLALLADIGVVPDKVLAADIDETPARAEKPRALAERLAKEKLQVVAPKFIKENAFILAADTVVGVGRRILPKAETSGDVRRFLELMSGRRHHVYTGVALRTPGGKILRRVSDSTVISANFPAKTLTLMSRAAKASAKRAATRFKAVRAH